MIILPLLLAAAATAAPDRFLYDCTIDKQFVITPAGGSWNESQVQFPTVQQADWRFTIDLKTGDNPTAKVNWTKDPIQIAGEHAALELAPGHFAFAAVAGGNCMFTEEACLAMVEIADRDETSASILIAPAGLSRDKDGKRSLLQVTSLGHCSRTTEGR
ncbi:MAG TPA: hypothetical protein VFW19_18580 [Allosphingosinicella sp.]|nr:hypothetical protein [Allosphingosinicella sp.]